MSQASYDILFGKDAKMRKALCAESFPYFAVYYFAEYFKYRIPKFHRDMYHDLNDMMVGKVKELVWIMFRESAKTSIAKIFLVWCICYKYKLFINYDAYDGDNSEAALFDVAMALQTNSKIIRDFGQLYFEEDPRARKSEIKRISEFITTNNVKVKAYSTGKSTRGRIFKDVRPDLYVLDDFETSKTKDSAPITNKIISHIDEMRTGLGPDGNVIYLCNYITEKGSVAYLKSIAEKDRMMRVRDVPVIKDGEIMWPDKYVMTEEEAAEANKIITDKEKKKISLDAKRISLGNNVFESEMMNNPGATSDIVFDRQIIDELLKRAQAPRREIAGFKIYEEYNPKWTYFGGGDTSEGVGRDANASVLIRSSAIDKTGITDRVVTRRPAKVVGVFANADMPPDIFAHELKREGEMYGECLWGVEINNTGFATMNEMKRIYSLKKIYRRVRKDLVTQKVTEELGWKTTSATKPDIIYQLKSAVEDGELEVLDEGLLLEMKYFTLTDMKEIAYHEDESRMTKHFDKLMACAIAWEMRHHAQVKSAEKKYAPKPYVPRSEYEGGDSLTMRRVI